MSPLTRALRKARRETRLVATRARHRGLALGSGCDVRPGLRLTLDGGTATFGAGCVLDHGMTVESHGRLVVGERVVFGHHCTIGVKGTVTIGDDCLIAEMVSIRDHDHRFDSLGVPVRQQGAVVSDVTIGRNVWLASRVVVTRGVTIGDDAIVGAGAVVTSDIPARAIAVGVPARVVRYRGVEPSTSA